MFLKRAAWSIASIFLGLTATVAQAQVQGTVAPGQAQTTSVTPPLFQGIMVDAKGKNVGRIYVNALASSGGLYGPAAHMVIRQIDGVWVGLPVTDFTSGFTPYDPTSFQYYYPSADCTGQAYMFVNRIFKSNGAELAAAIAPPIALVTTIPPSTEPYIYFAGAPAFVSMNSIRVNPNAPCALTGPSTLWMGPIQSVPVSSLGLTLPFKVK